MGLFSKKPKEEYSVFVAHYAGFIDDALTRDAAAFKSVIRSSILPAAAKKAGIKINECTEIIIPDEYYTDTIPKFDVNPSERIGLIMLPGELCTAISGHFYKKMGLTDPDHNVYPRTGRMQIIPMQKEHMLFVFESYPIFAGCIANLLNMLKTKNKN